VRQEFSERFDVMNYQQWLATVPPEFTNDSLWRMEVYRLALFVGDVAWIDVTKLMQDRRTLDLAGQLYRAAGSVSANIAEGYGRSSHKDQVRFFEYALGSARESRNWYWAGRNVLTEVVALHRIRFVTQIIRHLLNIIPTQRGHALHEDAPPYLVNDKAVSLEELLADTPLPPPTT
jgi:four helix bundle protein